MATRNSSKVTELRPSPAKIPLHDRDRIDMLLLRVDAISDLIAIAALAESDSALREDTMQGAVDQIFENTREVRAIIDRVSST